MIGFSLDATNHMNENISRAVSMFRSSPKLDDVAIHRALAASGIEQQLAARLVEFLPIVYSRLLLADSGAQFSDEFRRPNGSYKNGLLSSEPLWDAAMAFARAERERGVPAKDLFAVAARSAEFDAANQLLNKGSKLENIRFTAVLFPWPENGPNAD
jgi:hypothetical protein